MDGYTGRLPVQGGSSSANQLFQNHMKNDATELCAGQHGTLNADMSCFGSNEKREILISGRQITRKKKRAEEKEKVY